MSQDARGDHLRVLGVNERDHPTLIVVPAWNEERNVGHTVSEILAARPEYDVVVIDDGSTDSTAAVARSAGAAVIQLPFNLGVGGAMRTGFTYALRHGYTRAIQVDADGQHNPADIDSVLEGLERADISIGARFAEVGDYDVKGPRRWAMIVLARVMSRVAGTKLTDATSGFRAAGPSAIAQYVRYYPAEYFGDTLDSLVAACHAGLTVTQVPVAMRPRMHGTSTQGTFGALVYLLRAVFALGLAVVRPHRAIGAVARTEEPA
ncbi:glycosyltransferase family 2 protein [Microbacterium kitamiense]|uniref:Glycosyltransferase family 2 protein n=1 Tax=Microbacterium aurantiacum TaxID=162393 RepID=A0AAJ2HAN2_9MICO|nr:glycosyltransferase family 2 protein [Microbacterium aurantiacum]